MSTFQTTQATGQQFQQAQGVGSPISNEAYNVLTALQSKLEGLEAASTLRPTPVASGRI